MKLRPSTVKIEELPSGSASGSAAAAAGSGGTGESQESVFDVKKQGKGRPRAQSAAFTGGSEAADIKVTSAKDRAKSREPTGLAQPVEPSLDITTRVAHLTKAEWTLKPVADLRYQLIIRKVKEYGKEAIKKMPKKDVIDILLTLDIGKPLTKV